MTILYSFVDLTDEQKHRRRELLDRYGLIAQASVLVPLLVIQVYFLLSWIRARLRSGQNLTPSSPKLKSRQDYHDLIERFASTVRKALWWAGEDIHITGIYLGTKGEIVGAAAWIAWLLLLSFLQTGDDYLHLTKRLGIVAASQLPFHYLLSIKTPYSPLQYITGASHETLNSIHQLLGRIVTALIYGHVILYLNFYVQVGVLAVRLKEAYVLCGLVSVIFFTIIGTSSLAAVRKASYKIFLGLHITLSMAILPLLYFHVHHIRIYIYETLAIVIANIVFRNLAAKSYSTASIRLIPNTQLIDISIALDSKAATAKWMPGQHAYLSLPGHPLKAVIAKNPFTLSSVPVLDKQLRFVARIMSGNTAALAKVASSGKGTHTLLVEGPYGVATYSDKLMTFDRVLLIAGGVGGTFIMPLYRQLLADLSPSRGSYRRQKVAAVWVARSSADVMWAMPKDDNQRSDIAERLHVFVTGQADRDLQHCNSVQLYDKLRAHDADDDGIELQEQSGLLAKDVDSDAKAPADLRMYSGRPNVARLVDQAMSGSSERVAVVVCGPPALGQAVRKEVGPWVYKGRDVWFWNEYFGLR